MSNSGKILKKAFIDAYSAYAKTEKYHFSKVFEIKMENLIKRQKSVRRFIDTVGKKVACFILALLILFTSTIFGVEALRRPVFNAVEKFFVAVKDLLSGNETDNIAELFTNDITEIVVTNFITSVPKQYLIDSERVDDFVKLMTDSRWINPTSDYNADAKYKFYSFRFKSNNRTVATLNLCGYFSEGAGIVEIVVDDESRVFNISSDTYLDIMTFTTRKYRLHQSDILLPDETVCKRRQEAVYEGLLPVEKADISRRIGEIHSIIEYFLLEKTLILTEVDSMYWNSAITGESVTDPISGECYENGEYSLNGFLNKIKSIERSLHNEETKAILRVAAQDLEAACEYHDISGIYTVHEKIHDLDYYAANYPPNYDVLNPPEWDGIRTYFGHLD